MTRPILVVHVLYRPFAGYSALPMNLLKLIFYRDVQTCLPDFRPHGQSRGNKPIWGHDEHNLLPVNYHQHQIKKTQPRPTIAA